MAGLSFPTFVNKKTWRAPTNPLDVSTVFSIFPKEINEIKHTIQPGQFVIPAGSYEKPSSLVVGPSSWWKEMEDSQPLLEIPQSSIQVADAIVKDYCSGILECNMADIKPGIFFIPGRISVLQMKTEHKVELETVYENQKRWYTKLVALADGLWVQSGGNPLTISEDMKIAARELNLNGKEWLADFQMAQMVRCLACGSMRNPMFPICPSCHQIIDAELYKKLNIQTVQPPNSLPAVK